MAQIKLSNYYIKNIVKLALAGAMVAEASATRSASELVAEAMAKVESGSASYASYCRR